MLSGILDLFYPVNNITITVTTRKMALHVV